MGHTVAINFSVPSLKGADSPPETFQILGIPNYDGHCIQNVDDLTESIQNICDAEIKVMNDFDIAWVTQQRVKFPKVPKRKIKKQKVGSDDDEEEDEEEEEEDEDEEEEEDEENEDDEEEKSASVESGSQGSDKGSDEGSEDENPKKKTKKEEKIQAKKPLAFMTGGVKGTKSEKPKKKARVIDEDDENLPYEKMSEEQKRNYDVMVFQRGLDRKKTYFNGIEEIIVPITEAREFEEQSNEEPDPVTEAPVEQPIEKKRKKDSDEESGSAEESDKKKESEDEEDEEGEGEEKEEKEEKEEEKKSEKGS